MKSGMMVERRDQVLIGFLSLALARLRLFHQVGVTERPFFNERVMIYPYFLPRRETIIEVVRLLLRVFLPLVCWPHGETG
jgi:hypothetical protein